MISPPPLKRRDDLFSVGDDVCGGGCCKQQHGPDLSLHPDTEMHENGARGSASSSRRRIKKKKKGEEEERDAVKGYRQSSRWGRLARSSPKENKNKKVNLEERESQKEEKR